MDWDEFATWGAKAADWGKEYHQNLRDRPVRSQVALNDTLNALPKTAPEECGNNGRHNGRFRKYSDARDYSLAAPTLFCLLSIKRCPCVDPGRVSNLNRCPAMHALANLARGN